MYCENWVNKANNTYQAQNVSYQSNDIFCWNCGRKNDRNTKYCYSCGCALNNNYTPPEMNQYNNSYGLTCPKCGGHNVHVQIVSENKKVGCGTVLLCILFSWTIIGLIILIKLFANNTVSRKYYVCQTCGNTYGSDDKDNLRDNLIGNIIASIIILIGIAFIIVCLS